jgi:hypothetical protein
VILQDYDKGFCDIQSVGLGPVWFNREGGEVRGRIFKGGRIGKT